MGWTRDYYNLIVIRSQVGLRGLPNNQERENLKPIKRLFEARNTGKTGNDTFGMNLFRCKQEAI
jgi:hypothetical protein